MTRRAALAAALLLLSATVAEAALIEVRFEGTLTEIIIALSPGGGPLVGSPFSGTLRYDADQPPIDPDVPAVFDFADGSASLSILLAGFLYETDASAPAVTLSRRLFTADPDTGEPVDPTDPITVLAGLFNMSSTMNVGGDYDIDLEWRQIPILDFENLLLPPQSNALIADHLVGGLGGPGVIRIATPSASFTGEITRVVPEPVTALLLGGGLLALGLQRARKG